MELSEVSRVRALSDGDLLSGLSAVLRASRRAVAEVIAHLGEVEERRLHLLAGYGSMFAYCVSRLGMSEDEACRRIDVARLVRRFPLLYERLAGEHVSLSVAALLKPHLTEANGATLLDAVSGKTVGQAREVLAAWFPQPDVAPSIRKLPTRTARGTTPGGAAPECTTELPAIARFEGAPSPAPATLLPDGARTLAPQPDTVGTRVTEASPPVDAGGSMRHAAVLPPARSLGPPRSIVPLSPERYKLQLTAGGELKRKLELARDLMRHAIPSGDLAAIVERALDTLLEQVMKRRFGATARPRASAPSTTKPPAASAALESPPKRLEPLANGPEPPARESPAPALPATSGYGRHLPSAVRRTVLSRDGLRCTWQGPDGVCCNERAWLEHDHVMPRGHGGGNEPLNIRPLCRAHNRLAAELVYGQETITRIIAARRRARRPRSSTAVRDGAEESARPSGPRESL